MLVIALSWSLFFPGGAGATELPLVLGPEQKVLQEWELAAPSPGLLQEVLFHHPHPMK